MHLNGFILSIILVSISPALSRELQRRACTYSVVAATGDTCASISAEWGITETDFIQYNPSVGSNCSKGVTVGESYCVEWDDGQKTTTTTTTTATTTTSALPTPTQSGLTKNCTAFYKVVSGDTCQKIVGHYNTFTLDNFYDWNPAIGDDCADLETGYYVCVGVPGTPTSPVTTTTATNTSPQPEQTGIESDCKNWHKVVSGDSCQKIVDEYDTFTLDQFYKWNPAVGSDCTSLILGYYVCVGVPGTPTIPITKTTATSTSTGPSPEQTGITKNCNKFYKVVSGDYCQGIASKNGISLQQFYSWNPAVGSDCKSLFLGYYVCVGVKQ